MEEHKRLVNIDIDNLYKQFTTLLSSLNIDQ